MLNKNNTKSKTLDNIEFLISIGQFKLRLSLPKNTTVAGLITILKGYDALHMEYGPQGQIFIGLAAYHTNAFLDYWLCQHNFDFMRFRKRLELKAIYGCERKGEHISSNEFEYLVCLGKGACGQVYLVRSRISGYIFAMKRTRKDTITNYNALMTQFKQRKNMIRLGTNAHTVTLHATFESKQHFNFILDYCPGGQLFLHLLNSRHKMNTTQIKTYFCQILLAMEYIHKKKLLYRDLKPENIFVDINGHLRIGDFGLSKCDFDEDDFANSICGSPQYMAPQILQNKDYNFAADFYSIGALLFQLVTGLPPNYTQEPIKDDHRLKLMKNIEVQINKATDDPLLKRLLNNLLHHDPDKRISNFQEIKNSAWLSDVNWKSIQSKTEVMALAPDPHHVYIGKQFLNLEKQVEEMNNFQDQSYYSQISGAFEYIRPESKKILGLDQQIQQSKILKQKQGHKDKKPVIKKANLSVAIIDRQDTSSQFSACQIRTMKHIENKENKQQGQNFSIKRSNSKKMLSKQSSHHTLVINTKTAFNNNSINLVNMDKQKSQRKLLINNFSHNTSECSSKGQSRSKDLSSRLQTVQSIKQSKSKMKSKQKSLKQTSIPKMFKRKQQKKNPLPTCSYKIKLS